MAQNNTRTTKQGKPYLEIVLADADGSMSIKVWDNAPWHGAFAPLQANAAVAVTGNWQMNQYGMDASDLDVRPSLRMRRKPCFPAAPGCVPARRATGLR